MFYRDDNLVGLKNLTLNAVTTFFCSIKSLSCAICYLIIVLKIETMIEKSL